jgi:hypothetical protein
MPFKNANPAVGSGGAAQKCSGLDNNPGHSRSPSQAPALARCSPPITTIAIESIRQRIISDLKRYGVVFAAEHLLNESSVQDSLRFEIARALDGGRVQLMVMHHAFDAETVVNSVDEWLKRWPQHMAIYVDVNLYVN